MATTTEKDGICQVKGEQDGSARQGKRNDGDPLPASPSLAPTTPTVNYTTTSTTSPDNTIPHTTTSHTSCTSSSASSSIIRVHLVIQSSATTPASKSKTLSGPRHGETPSHHSSPLGCVVQLPPLPILVNRSTNGDESLPEGAAPQAAKSEASKNPSAVDEGQGRLATVADYNIILRNVLSKEELERGPVRPEPYPPAAAAAPAPAPPHQSLPTPRPKSSPDSDVNPPPLPGKAPKREQNPTQDRSSQSAAPSQPHQLAEASDFNFVTDMGQRYYFTKPLHILGRGTYGVVVQARCKQTGALVAIKGAPATEPNLELEVLLHLKDGIQKQELGHEYVLRLLDTQTIGNTTYTVTAAANGGTVWQMMDGMPSHLREAVVWKLAEHQLLGIIFMHRRNTVHRDIGPNNCMLHNSKGVQDLTDSATTSIWIDFGQGVIMESSREYHMKAAMSFGGTPNFKAPEVLIKGDCNIPHGKPVDMASFGLLLCFLLTKLSPNFNGELPKGELDNNGVRMYAPKQVEGALGGMIEYLAPHVSPKGLLLIKGLLTLDPNERWTCEEAAVKWPTGPLIAAPYDKCRTPNTPTIISQILADGVLSKSGFIGDTRHQYLITSGPQPLGSTGVFVKAKDQETGDFVVIRVLQRTVSNNPSDDYPDPIQELHTLRQLTEYMEGSGKGTLGSENVIRLEDSMVTNAFIYIVTKDYEGSSLWDMIKTGNLHLPEADAWRFGGDVVQGLLLGQHCPGRVHHGNLTPRSLFFTNKKLREPDTRGVLAGFGYAVTSVEEGSPPIAPPKPFKHSPASEPLETSLAYRNPHHASNDMLAVGALLAFMLVGELLDLEPKGPEVNTVDAQGQLQARCDELIAKAGVKVGKKGLELLKGLLVADRRKRWPIARVARNWPSGPIGGLGTIEAPSANSSPEKEAGKQRKGRRSEVAEDGASGPPAKKHRGNPGMN